MICCATARSAAIAVRHDCGPRQRQEGVRRRGQTVSAATRAAGLTRRPRTGLRTRDLLGGRARPARAPGRAVLSAAGMALGVATMVAVARDLEIEPGPAVAQIDALGTNLLTVTPGQSSAAAVTLPATAPAMVGRIGPVLGAAAIGEVPAQRLPQRPDRVGQHRGHHRVYRGHRVAPNPAGPHGQGRFLNAATADTRPWCSAPRRPTRWASTGATDGPGVAWQQWFSVIGILEPLPLAPELDRSALVGFPVAEQPVHASRGRSRCMCGPSRTASTPCRACWPPRPIRPRRRTSR